MIGLRPSSIARFASAIDLSALMAVRSWELKLWTTLEKALCDTSIRAFRPAPVVTLATKSGYLSTNIVSKACLLSLLCNSVLNFTSGLMTLLALSECRLSRLNALLSSWYSSGCSDFLVLFIVAE